MKNFIYNTKCRRCNKTLDNWFGDENSTDKKMFLSFIHEHSIIPIQRQCICYNGGITLQDIVSHNSII